MDQKSISEFYELNTDEFYAYGYEDEGWANMKYEVVLRDNVEPALLQAALELMCHRFPYFKVMISQEENPGRRVLRTNPNKPQIFESTDYIATDDPKLCGHRISISYHQKTVKFLISHVITDGVGAKAVIETVLISYFQLKYENKSIDDIRNALPKPDEEKEYGNPFASISEPEFSHVVNPKKSFRFDETDVSDDAMKTLCFSVPQDPILTFAKSRESSVAAVFSWFIMRTIFDVKKPDLPVTVAVPIDVRKHIGHPDTVRNCNTTLYLHLTPEFLKNDTADQLTAIRAQMYLQADEINVLPKVYASYMNYLEASKCKTFSEKFDYYHSDDNLTFHPIVTYVGTFDLKGYEPYYKKIDCFLPVSGPAGILTSIIHNKGMFNFRLTMNLKDFDTYKKAFFNVLEENEIEAVDVVEITY